MAAKPEDCDRADARIILVHFDRPLTSFEPKFLHLFNNIVWVAGQAGGKPNVAAGEDFLELRLSFGQRPVAPVLALQVDQIKGVSRAHAGAFRAFG